MIYVLTLTPRERKKYNKYGRVPKKVDIPLCPRCGYPMAEQACFECQLPGEIVGSPEFRRGVGRIITKVYDGKITIQEGFEAISRKYVRVEAPKLADNSWYGWTFGWLHDTIMAIRGYITKQVFPTPPTHIVLEFFKKHLEFRKKQGKVERTLDAIEARVERLDKALDGLAFTRRSFTK